MAGTSTPTTAPSPSTQAQPPKTEPLPGGFISSTLFQRRSEFLKNKSVKIKVGSWNLAAFEDTEHDLASWLIDEPPHASNTLPKQTKKHGKLSKWIKGSIARRVLNGKEEEEEEEPSNEEEGEEDAGEGVELEEDDDEVGIYAICLQEVVDVGSAENFVRSSDTKAKKMWGDTIDKALPGYECVAAQQLIGLLLFVYVSPKVFPQVTTPSSTSVGTGLMGYIGNKGAALARIVLGGLPSAGVLPPKDDSSLEDAERGLEIVFVDSHLAAFANAVERRNWDYAEIQRRAFFHPKPLLDEMEPPLGIQMYNADIVVWCGDLNYRIDLPGDEIRRILHPFQPPEADGSEPPLSLEKDSDEETVTISQRNFADSISHLLKFDQLHAQQRLGKAFQYYHEGPINFLPTYKYDVGKISTFDSSEKRRGPSYCDRILWKVRSVAVIEADRIKQRDLAADRDKTREKLMDKPVNEILFDLGRDQDNEDEDSPDDGTEEDLAALKKNLADEALADQLPDMSMSDIPTPMKLLSYTSYHSITSSDHKPISASFKLEYVATNTEARSKIYAEVVKDLDRFENDARPVVTVVVDEDKEGNGVADFEDVRWGEQKSRTITVANVGRSAARCEFVKRPVVDDLISEDAEPDITKLSIDSSEGYDPELAFGGDDGSSSSLAGSKEEVSREWLSAVFNSTDSAAPLTLEPGDAESITLTISLPPANSSNTSHANLLRQLNQHKIQLQDVLVLRIENGRDIFIPVKADFQTTFLGFPMSALLSIPDKSGGIRVNWSTISASDTRKWSAPRELFRMTEFLLLNIKIIVGAEGGEGVRWSTLPGWPFVPSTWSKDLQDGRRMQLRNWIREALDCDDEWRWGELSVEYSNEDKVEVVAEILCDWLALLQGGVVPTAVYDQVMSLPTDGDGKVGADRILDADNMPSVNANVFIYLTGFVGEMITMLTPNVVGHTGHVRIPSSPTRRSGSRVTTREMVRNGIVGVFADLIIRGRGPERRGEREKRRKFLMMFL